MKRNERRLRRSIRFVAMMFIAVGLAFFGGARGGMAQSKPPAKSAPAKLPGVALDENHNVGAPFLTGNLAIFPIYAKVQEELSEFTTLEAALEKGTAVVREVGAERRGDGARAHSGGPEVNTLVIENRGKLTILVLAGTVVKGGNQDRQIGEDFVIGAGKTVPIDAYCVEHGRWNGVRDGQATQGTFKATKTLATSKVRAAGQHQRNQSSVWAEVGAVNAANKKSAASDTLMATLDDNEIQTRRAAISTKASAHLASVEQGERVVGFAYAVDGKVRGVRWFWSHKLWQLHKDTLLNTAAVEAITVEAAASGKPSAASKPAPEAVAQFIAEIQRAAKVEERATRADNVNAYQAAEAGYGSKTMVPASPSAGAPKKPVSVDFVAK